MAESNPSASSTFQPDHKDFEAQFTAVQEKVVKFNNTRFDDLKKLEPKCAEASCATGSPHSAHKKLELAKELEEELKTLAGVRTYFDTAPFYEWVHKGRDLWKQLPGGERRSGAFIARNNYDKDEKYKEMVTRVEAIKQAAAEKVAMAEQPEPN
jgi:hypothetical protein